MNLVPQRVTNGAGLVDLDLQRGDVAAFLNLTPLNSIATIAAATGPVDDIFPRRYLTRHPRGVFVPPRPPRSRSGNRQSRPLSS